MKLILTIVGNALALLATAYVVPGIRFSGDWVQLLVAGALFGLLNLIVRPIALLLSLPALVLTLGLFYFVLNGLLLWGFSKFMPGYDVDGLWAGILGSFVIMVVNWVVGLFGPKRASSPRRTHDTGSTRKRRIARRKARTLWTEPSGSLSAPRAPR